jgi:hypothetical protein
LGLSAGKENTPTGDIVSAMLVFLDESGDTGRKIPEGSSKFFVVTAVIFSDKEEALACDQRISLLRRELGKEEKFEFHFAHNSRNIRRAFLEAVNPYNFTYCTVVIDKDPQRLYGEGFNNKTSFYKYACNMVFTNAIPYLEKATVIIDKSGSSTFQGELRKYLRGKVDGSGAKIKKIKQQSSHINNLLQVADYCVSIGSRKAQKKSDWNDYYKYIASKELSWQEWPKYT